MASIDAEEEDGVPRPPPALPTSDSDEEVMLMDLTIHFHGTPTTIQIRADITVDGFASAIEKYLFIQKPKQKIMISPKPGILRHPFPDTPLADLLTPKSKISLFGSTDQEIGDLNSAIAKGRQGGRLRGGNGSAVKTATPSRYRDWQKVSDESKYTFLQITPLPYLPNPERSTRFLERLANDPGITAAMRAHKFSVGLLTEMNPAEHTTQESRTLGLNRNRGEVIELRLRTDRYDGYRDYKVIRNTLCHELAHNVWGEHDRNFWDLTKQIEKEVERADWKHGGHRLTEGEFYNPADDGQDADYHDAGGWAGGEYVLGSDEAAAGITNDGLSRREILARAALSRIEKEKSAKRGSEEEDAQDKPSGST